MSSLMSHNVSYDTTTAWAILWIAKEIASVVWVEASIVALAVLTFAIFRVHKLNTIIGPNQAPKVLNKTVTDEDVVSQKEEITSEPVARREFSADSWHFILNFSISLTDIVARYLQDHVRVVTKTWLATLSSQHLVHLSRDWACWSCSYGSSAWGFFIAEVSQLSRRYKRKQWLLIGVSVFSIVGTFVTLSLAAMSEPEPDPCEVEIGSEDPLCAPSMRNHYILGVTVFVFGALSNCESYFSIPVM